FGGDQNARSERAAAVVNFSLGKIKRVFAFNVARTHIVANGVAENFPAGTDQQCEFWFRHRPLGVLANGDFVVMADDAAGCRFEKNFRTLRSVHAVVEISAARGLRLLHPRGAAAKISYACCPYFLAANWWAERLRIVQRAGGQLGGIPHRIF